MTECVYIRVGCCPGSERSVLPVQIERLGTLFPELLQEDRNGKAIVLMNAPADDLRVKRLLDEIQQSGVDIWQRDFLKSGFGVSITRSRSLRRWVTSMSP
jgi:hypothetical protein